jgi:hypothetical protein
MKKTKENMDQWENRTLRKVLERSREREEVFRTENRRTDQRGRPAAIAQTKGAISGRKLIP